MHDSRTNPRGNFHVWLVIQTATVFAALALGSGVLAFCGLMGYTDSYSHEADRRWGIIAMAVGGLLFLTATSSVLYLIVRNRATWSTAVGLLVVSGLGLGALTWAGLDMLEASRRRGGDWAAVGNFASLLLGIACPGLLGLVLLAGGGSLWAMRRRTAQSEYL